MLILPHDTIQIYHGEAAPATAMTRSTKIAHRRRTPTDDVGTSKRSPPRHPCRGAGRWTQAGRKRTEERIAARYPHDISMTSSIASRADAHVKSSRPTSRETGRGEDDKRTRGKQVEDKRRETMTRRGASPGRRTERRDGGSKMRTCGDGYGMNRLSAPYHPVSNTR